MATVSRNYCWPRQRDSLLCQSPLSIPASPLRLEVWLRYNNITLQHLLRGQGSKDFYEQEVACQQGVMIVCIKWVEQTTSAFFWWGEFPMSSRGWVGVGVLLVHVLVTWWNTNRSYLLKRLITCHDAAQRGRIWKVWEALTAAKICRRPQGTQ